MLIIMSQYDILLIVMKYSSRVLALQTGQWYTDVYV